VSGELRVASEAVDRADLGEQLGRGDGGAAGQLEQRGRDSAVRACSSCSSSAIARLSERMVETSSRAIRTSHNVFADAKQLPLEPAGELAAVLNRPQPLRAQAAAQPSSSSLPTAIAFSSSGLPASSTATAVTDCSCTSSPSTIMGSPPSRSGRPTSGQTSIKADRPRSYQVTLDGLGRRRRHNAGKSDLPVDIRNRVSRRRPSL
jgi:hypothetical protein